MENKTDGKGNILKAFARTPERILIVQTAYIGDVVLIEPLIARAKKTFPQSAIDVVVIPDAANLLETHPFVREIIIYDKRGQDRGLAGFRKKIAKLKSRKYDLALVPHRSLRSALLVYFARIPIRIGFHKSAGRWLFSLTVPYRESHEVIRNLGLLQAFGMKPVYRRPRLYPTSADREKVSQALTEMNGLKIALAPGSIWPTKRWPESYFLQLGCDLIQQLGAHLILIGGEKDRGLSERMAKSLGKRCLNRVGDLSLRESVAILQQCDLLISNDSAPTHLGIAAGCKVVTIFGPTLPAFGFYPCGPEHRIIETERSLSCRPCGIHGHNRCPVGTFECMLSIAPDRVFKTIRLMMNPQTQSREMAGATSRK